MSPTQFAPKRDRQTVRDDGTALKKIIQDVKIRPLISQQDERGEVVEMFDPRWGFHDAPLVYVYQVRIRPKKVKGWVYHELQEDRIFFCKGTMQAVLYDNREHSPTYQTLNKFIFSERNPSILVIPPFVFHAIQNIGEEEAIFINMPTKPYNHQNPDKYRLPLENDIIPYSFEDSSGG